MNALYSSSSPLGSTARSRRSRWDRAWLAGLIAAGCLTPLASAEELAHGVFVGSSCPGPICAGQAVECRAVISYADDAGDAVVVREAFQIVAPDESALRFPESGNLPILQLLGNARALGPDGTFPVLLGPPGSTYESPEFPGQPLPGILNSGVVVVINDQYVPSPDDPNPLAIETDVRWQDTCSAGLPACDYISTLSFTTSSAVTLLSPGVTVTAAVEPGEICVGIPTEVEYTVTVSAGGGTADLDDVFVDLSACESLAGPFGDDGDGVLRAAEPFTDSNGNGVCEPGEPFDDSNGNGTWDDEEIWTYFCSAVRSEPETATATVAARARGADDCPTEASATVTLGERAPSGFADLLTVLQNWGPCPGPCPPSCEGDRDGDCEVGMGDVMLLLMQWGACE